MPIEKILVPIDFSPLSTFALEWAVACGHRYRASILLMNVLESEESDSSQTSSKLAALVAPGDQEDLSLQTLVRHGNPTNQILSVAREYNADLIVMGTHSGGILKRLFIGSVTLGVLRHCDVPILTVSPALLPHRFERVLFAADLAGNSLPALQAFLDFAQPEISKLICLHAVETDVQHLASAVPGLVQNTRSRLEQLTEEGSRRRIPVEDILAEGVPADAILNTAKDRSADLIVLSTTEKSLLDRALLGSTAERVIRESEIPVLSIPKSEKVFRRRQSPAA
jgi:nucleotide-binding universal stress UspA family protein